MRFIQPFWQEAEKGYDLIYDLVKAKKFDSFASQYSFYLGEIERDCNEYHNAYIEIVWDYKTYFESLSMSQLDVIPESKDPSENSFVEALRKFKQLPIGQQVEVLEAFSSKVEECKTATSSSEVVKLSLNGKTE